MENLTDNAAKLINDQISIVVQLQQHAIEAINRNDWQSVAKIVETIESAFGTFLKGVGTMSIDVSNLKNVLTQGSINPDTFKSLQEKVNNLDSQLSGFQQLQQDVSDLKSALEQLNSAAGNVTTGTVSTATGTTP